MMMQVDRVNSESPSSNTLCALCTSSFPPPRHSSPLPEPMRLRKQKIELDFRITSEWCMHLMHMNERTECPLIKLIPLPASLHACA